uniref:Secreted protein n=1 Tax=Rhabditophanes sp. KR3021 TaxID=114890 RepID=A0AC35UFP0_9BILA
MFYCWCLLCLLLFPSNQVSIVTREQVLGLTEAFSGNVIENGNNDVVRRNNLIYPVNEDAMPMIPLPDYEGFATSFDGTPAFKDKRQVQAVETAFVGADDEAYKQQSTPTSAFATISTSDGDATTDSQIEGSATIEPLFVKIFISPDCKNGFSLCK